MDNVALQKFVDALSGETRMELERGLLGCILFNPNILTGELAYWRAGEDGQEQEVTIQAPGLIGNLEPDMFFELKHRETYRAILEMHEKGIEIDNLTLANYIPLETLREWGGPAYITSLINDCPTYMHYHTYAVLLREEWKQRQMADVGGMIVTAAKNRDNGLRNKAYRKIEALQAMDTPDGQGLTGNGDSVADLLLQWYGDPQEIRGYRTGIEELDIRLGGLDTEEFLVLLGYSGSGKSTMLTQFALTFAEQGPGLIIPTEMSVVQYKIRMVAYLLGTDYKTLKLGQYRDMKRMLEAVAYLDNLPIHWYKSAEPTPEQIRVSARNLKRTVGAEWCIVDGLHDVKSEGDIYERTNAAVDALHAVMMMGYRVVASGHINRGATKEPNPRDALGSSRIEQRATAILTLYRPGHLLESGEIETLPDDIPNPNLTRLRLAKSRFSETGLTIELMFTKIEGRHGFHSVERSTRTLVNLAEWER